MVSLALALLAFLAACSAPLPPAFFSEGRERLAGRFSSKWDSLRTLRGEARISLAAGEGVFPGRLAFLMKKPGLARADFFDPFGRPRGVVVISGNEVREYMPSSGGEEEPPEISLLSRLAREKGTTPAEAVAALAAGQPGGLGESVVFRLPSGPPEGEPGLARGAVVLLRAFGDDPVPAGVLLGETGSPERAEVAYGDYATAGGIILPRIATVTLPGRGWKLEIHWGEVETNVDLDDELFSVRPGSGS